MSELKSISGSSRLPYGTLALGAEGIKNAIKSFDDAYVRSPFLPSSSFCSSEGLNDFARICPADANRISITSASLRSRSKRHPRPRPCPVPLRCPCPAQMGVLVRV